MGNNAACRARCLHCRVPLENYRPWPGLGLLADCPLCRSSRLLLARLDPEEREEIVIATQAVAFARGKLGTADRWIRAWTVVAESYLRAGDTDAAARCLDDSLTLLRVQARAAEVAAHAEAMAS